MNTFLAKQCTVWKCKQIGQQTLRFACGVTQFSFTPKSKQSTDINTVKEPPISPRQIIVKKKNVIHSCYAMDCPYRFNLSNMYCEKHKNTVSIIGNNLS